jgi:hypothetical protein
MKKKFYTAIAIIAFIGLSNASFAQSNHPREAEVNTRLAVQNSRIDNKEFNGSINGREADRLHRDDQRIDRQENRFEDRHDGHITRGEQRRLNFREDHASREIRWR